MYKIVLKAKDSITGPMDDSMKAHGNRTKSMEAENFNGPMGEFTKERIDRTKGMVMGNFYGQMVKNILAIGRTAARMELDS